MRGEYLVQADISKPELGKMEKTLSPNRAAHKVPEVHL
jgi:hypothetical protein